MKKFTQNKVEMDICVETTKGEEVELIYKGKCDAKTADDYTKKFKEYEAFVEENNRDKNKNEITNNEVLATELSMFYPDKTKEFFIANFQSSLLAEMLTYLVRQLMGLKESVKN